MNEGWMCPNCGGAHAPSVQTCPMTVSTTAIIDWSPQIHVEKCLHDVPVTSRCFACADELVPKKGTL